MTPASGTPGAVRPTDDGAVATAPDPSELTDAELAIVVGGGGDGSSGQQPIGSYR